MEVSVRSQMLHGIETEIGNPLLQGVVSQLKGGLPLHKAADAVRGAYGLPQEDRSSEEICRRYAAAALRQFFKDRYRGSVTALNDTCIDPPLARTKKKAADGTLRDVWESKLPNYLGGGFGGRPISVVGPAVLTLEIYGAKGTTETLTEDNVYIPLAPTRFGVAEGVSAGLKYISESQKPINLAIEKISRVTRSPIIEFSTSEAAEAAADRIRAGVKSLRETGEGDLFGGIKEAADRLMSPHGGSLDGLQTVTRGPHLWANFVYEMEGDNYGHEAGTAITREVVLKHILKQFPSAKYKMIAGGLDGDLRPATPLYGGMGNIRGRKVTASAEVTAETLKKRFGDISTIELQELDRLKQEGNRILGTHTLAGMGPEIVEAVFYTLEPPTSPFLSSTIHMETERAGDSLILKATFPNMEVGTISEAPISDVAAECRSLAGNIDGPGNPKGRNAIRMAACIAAAVLAGELNQYSQMATGRLGSEAYRKGI